MSNKKKFRRNRKNKSLGKRVSKLESEMNEREFKRFYTRVTIDPDNTLTTAANVVHITPIVRGASDDERNGSEAWLRSIRIKGFTNADANASLSAQVIRWVLFMVKDVGNSLPSLDQLLDDATVTKINAVRTRNNKGNYKILIDESMVFNQSVGAQSDIQLIDVYKKLKTKIEWIVDSSSGLIATATRNHYFIGCVANEGSVSAPDLDVQVELFYTDM